MPNTLKHHLPDFTYFFSVRLSDRNSTLLVDEVARLRNAMRMTRARYPFKIDAIAVLPSVIHTIWTLPKGESNAAQRWSMLKTQFARGLPAPLYRSASQARRRDKGIWQYRAWEHLIRDRADFDTHVQMIHESPVQAGLVSAPQDWPHSSVHRFVTTPDARSDAQGPAAAAPARTRNHQ